MMIRFLIRLGVIIMIVACGTVEAGDVFNGERVYRAHCSGCHGARGRGELPDSPNFTRGDGLMRSDLALLDAIETGRNAMPGYRGVLSEEEILDVITFVRTLH